MSPVKKDMYRIALLFLCSLFVSGAYAEAPVIDITTKQITSETDYQDVIASFNQQTNKSSLPEYSTSVIDGIQQLTKVDDVADVHFDSDEGYELKGPMWLPTGFWDGPSQTDLGYNALIFIFGEPVMVAWESITGNTVASRVLATDPNYRATLATTYAQMMNTLGMLIIGGVLTTYISMFFVKRSIEIGYLKGDEKEESLYSIGRGSGAMIGSLPITPFYGLSTFQMTTICAVLLGLGMSASIIRFSVGNLLTPSVIATQYPAVDDFIDDLLWSRICVNVLKPEFNSKIHDVTGAKGLDNDYLYIEAEDKVSTRVSFSNVLPSLQDSKTTTYKFYFGPDGECGSGVIGEIPRTDVSVDRWDNANEAIMAFSKSVMGNVALDTIRTAWSAIDPYAKNIAKENYHEMITSDGQKQAIVDAQNYAAFKTTISRNVTGSIHNALSELYSSPVLASPEGAATPIDAIKDQIADVGMLGLGTTYGTLAQLQDSFNDPIEDAFNPITDVTWKSNRISPWSKAQTLMDDIFNFFTGGGENAAELTRYVDSFMAFVSSPYSKGSSSVLTSSIDSITEAGLDQGILNWLARKAAAVIFTASSSSGITADPSMTNHSASDPILMLRNMGKTIQNGILLTWAVVPQLEKIKNALSDTSDEISKDDSNIDSEKMPSIIAMILYGLFTWGFFMTNILPQIPYIMWTIACFSYISFATMAIIGTGWWGGGMTQQGQARESMMGKSGEGLNIIISLIIRPPLMTIGFFLALILNKILGFVVTATIQPSIASANSGITNPLLFFGLLITVSTVLTIGIYKNCSLIWELTDLFMRWIGLDKDPLEKDGAHDSQQQFVSSGKSSSSSLNSILSSSQKGSNKSQIPFA